MLNTTKHRIILLNILREIFSDNQLAGQLVFKGGTCLMLFYGLDRFSTDLDFDLRDSVGTVDRARISQITSKYLNVDMDYDKHYTYYWSGSYETGLQRVKIEVNKRPWPQKIVLKNYLGLTIPTLAPDKMFAHKLVAITDRKTLQNRDLYDAYFMFSQGFEIDQSIIKLRTGMTLKKYLNKLLILLKDEKINKNIMFGLGEVLDSQRKAWVKANLVRELKAQIKIYLEAAR